MNRNLLKEVIKKAEHYAGIDTKYETDSLSGIDRELHNRATKTDPTNHDKWRSKQLSSERIINLFEKEAHNKKANYSSAGLQFEGTIQTLAKKYKTIHEIFRHCSNGQLLKYITKENQIINMKTGKVVYDENTKTIFQE